MTSNREIRTVRCAGVSCKSDAGLYWDCSYRPNLKLLSIYGSPQQVRAVFGRLVGWDGIEVIGSDGKSVVVYKNWYDSLRLRVYPIGYGKRHGLIFSEALSREVILWTSPAEKQRALMIALSKRRIPFDPLWIREIERVLLEDEQLSPLTGWGGFEGYSCSINDDRVCDLIVERILPLPLYREDRREQWSLESSLRSMAHSSAPV